MKKVLIIACCFLLFFNLVIAQPAKTIAINQSPVINQLIEKRIEWNARDQTTDGYRVQLFSGTSRSEAMTEKSKAESLFEETTIHIIYNQPYFKVRVGDFRTKLEAMRMQELLKEHFESMFIVKDNISLPPIK